MSTKQVLAIFTGKFPRRRCLLTLLSASFVLTLLVPIGAFATDLQAVLNTPRQRVKTADYRVVGRLVRVDASGTRTNFGVTIKARWFPGVLRVVVEVSSPQNQRAHILLETRTDGQDIIRIAHPGDKTPTTLPFEKWGDSPFGTGLTYEDFLQPEFFWPGQVLVEETKYGARLCDVVKSTPAQEDRTHYAEVRTWLDHSIGFPVYAEKTMKGNGTVKNLTYFGLRHDSGVWSASQVEGKLNGGAGSTLLIIEHGSAKANLTLGDFSPEHLVSF